MEEFNCNWSDEDKLLIQIQISAKRKYLLGQHSLIELSIDEATQLFKNLSIILNEVKK